MILIADSGSTKTDWRLLKQGKIIASFQTIGLNPFFKTSKEITQVLQAIVQKHIPSLDEVQTIYFYGAGCSSIPKNQLVLKAFRQVFAPTTTIHIQHDLLGAAIALCGNQKGIVSILGTGSNSCVFDGKKITQEQVSLGYILGDEGSGATIGKQLITDYLYGVLPDYLSQSFKEKYNLSKEYILDRVYKEPLPNRFLASFMPWISEHIATEAYLQYLVKSAFTDFIQKHILAYQESKELPLNSVGSVGFYFQQQLKEVAKEQGIAIGNIIKSPIDGMVKFYTK